MSSLCTLYSNLDNLCDGQACRQMESRAGGMPIWTHTCRFIRAAEGQSVRSVSNQYSIYLLGNTFSRAPVLKDSNQSSVRAGHSSLATALRHGSDAPLPDMVRCLHCLRNSTAACLVLACVWCAVRLKLVDASLVRCCSITFMAGLAFLDTNSRYYRCWL